MPESIRSVDVTIEVDTNKNTYKQSISLGEDESLEEFAARVLAELRELTEVNT